jgi:GLPGLI family protein
MIELKGNKNLEILETNISTNKIKFIKNFLDDTFLVVENRKSIDWKITTEKKMIGKFECLKAVGEFRNRTYIVYFCPSIQSQFGPWKLNGLPGLILEAQESNNLLRIFVKQVDVIQSTFSFLDFDYSLKSITLKEYVKLTDNFPNIIAEQVNLKLPRGVRLEGVTGVENQNKIEIFDETDF